MQMVRSAVTLNTIITPNCFTAKQGHASLTNCVSCIPAVTTPGRLPSSTPSRLPSSSTPRACFGQCLCGTATPRGISNSPRQCDCILRGVPNSWPITRGCFGECFRTSRRTHNPRQCHCWATIPWGIPNSWPVTTGGLILTWSSSLPCSCTLPCSLH